MKKLQIQYALDATADRLLTLAAGIAKSHSKCQ